MSNNYNTQYTTIYHETCYCIQYINGSLTMYYTAALLQALLESSDLKRAVDCSVRASRARLHRVQ